MDLFECLVTVFKWIKHEKEEKKMKTMNVGKFRKPAKIFARVAKFRRAPAFEFCTELQSAINFSSKLRFMRSWTLWNDL